MNLELNPEQAKLFAKLKAAYKACEKAGIYFVNNYGTLQAYDKALVDEYAEDLNERDEDVLQADDATTVHTFRIANEWCDDTHYIRLTKKGLKLKREQEGHDED